MKFSKLTAIVLISNFLTLISVCGGNYNSKLTGLDFTKAAELTLHAVVHIKTEFPQKNILYDDFFGLNSPFGEFFGNNPQFRGQKPEPLKGAGSGVIISSDGYIVTNNHVVQDADLIQVILNDKREYTAKVIGLDPTTDLALIKIDAKDLPNIIYANSDSVKVGQWVLAVGNPFNLTSTVTAGIISAKGRNLNILGGGTSIESYLQTDAAINPGNSGGALVNLEGKLVGINAAIATNTGSYSGYSFAIPVNIVKKVMEDIIKYGEVQRAFLGVSISEIDSKIAKEKNLENLKGVYVASTINEGSAKEAGILQGDIIIKIDNNDIENTAQLQEVIGRHRPNDIVKVLVLRNGKNYTIDVVLRNKYGNTSIVKKDENIITLLGATFESISNEEQNRLRIEGGIQIKKLNSGKLRSAGIREGFIITAIDKKPIRTIDDLRISLENKKGGILIEGVYPNGMRSFYAFGI